MSADGSGGRWSRITANLSFGIRPMQRPNWDGLTFSIQAGIAQVGLRNPVRARPRGSHGNPTTLLVSSCWRETEAVQATTKTGSSNPMSCDWVTNTTYRPLGFPRWGGGTLSRWKISPGCTTRLWRFHTHSDKEGSMSSASQP